MPIVPRGVAYPEKFAAAIAEVERMLAPDVVRIRYSIKNDWSGDEAVYLRVLLSDQASTPRRLRKVAGRVEALISEKVDPLNMGARSVFEVS